MTLVPPRLWFGACALAACMATGCSSKEGARIGDGPLRIDQSDLSSYAATWDGYIEAHVFRNGSDRVRVVIDSSGNGWLQVGDGELLPAPTDSDAGWPEAVREDGIFADFDALYPGLQYPIQGAVVEANRLRFATNASAPYGAWCAIQTPVRMGEDEGPGAPEYSCVTSRSLNGGEQEPCTIDGVDVDCSKAVGCVRMCDCSQTECHGRPNVAEIIGDAALSDDGETLTGTLLLIELDRKARTIRLERTD